MSTPKTPHAPQKTHAKPRMSSASRPSDLPAEPFFARYLSNVQLRVKTGIKAGAIRARRPA